MRRAATCLAVALGVTFLGTGCGPKAATPDIGVGLLAELTGELAAVGQSCKNGAELAAFDVNEGGGFRVGEEIHGIRLVVEDTASRPAAAAEAAQRLIADPKIVALIGPSASLGALPVAAVAESSKILMISPWSTHPSLTLDATTGQPRRYVYRACYTDDFQARFLARFAIDYERTKNAAILYESNSEAPKTQAELFKKEFEALGGSVVAFEAYETGTKDFAALMKKVVEAKPEIVFLPNYYTDVAVQLKQGREAGLKVPFLGSDNWNAEQLLKLAPKEVEGSFFPGHYFPGARVDAVAKFVTTYKHRFGHDPDDVAALAYDSVVLLTRAMEAASAPAREPIREGMAKIPSFEGVTGKMTFRTADPIKSGAMLKASGGKIAFVTSIDP
ncbi:MAG: ethanolamine utilization protein EutJ [Acidobacteria bacterium]|nr:MAG: ethanolamine utilization protein EutJ [Acidobacteriota bacterium]